MKDPCVYILASGVNGTLYVGVTRDVWNRMEEHTKELISGFTKTYGIKDLVYYEFHPSMTGAIKREHQLKRWRRLWKIRLIEEMNPDWANLYDPTTRSIAFGSGDIEAKDEVDDIE